jgi:hypothetical protein
MEVWKDICGYEGLYQVSNMGRVKRLFKDGKDRVLRGKKDKDGYIEVILSGKPIKKYCRLHRLVAEAFIPNPFGKAEINHKDRDKQNNVVSNLEWVTASENVRHTFLTGRKIHKSPVIQYDLNMEAVAIWDSIKDACQKLKVKSSNVSACCNGRLKTVGGFIWRYKEGDAV